MLHVIILRTVTETILQVTFEWKAVQSLDRYHIAYQQYVYSIEIIKGGML